MTCPECGAEACPHADFVLLSMARQAAHGHTETDRERILALETDNTNLALQLEDHEQTFERYEVERETMRRELARMSAALLHIADQRGGALEAFAALARRALTGKPEPGDPG